DDLRDLQHVIDEKYLMKERDIIAAAYNLLGFALQLLGDTESARRVFSQAVELDPDTSTNPSVKRTVMS
ncbi:Hypothetical predicted protein, partial [Mytilus galloprovincialis]